MVGNTGRIFEGRAGEREDKVQGWLRLKWIINDELEYFRLNKLRPRNHDLARPTKF